MKQNNVTKIAIVLLLVLATLAAWRLGIYNCQQQHRAYEIDVTPTEDLMREHGILRRVLLIYEEVIKRIDSNAELPVQELAVAANIIRAFIEDYHEKLEESYIFPLFEQQGKELELVAALRQQHTEGRALTAGILALATAQHELDAQILKKMLQEFIDLYRPHAAREDTVLFGQVRSLLTAHAFQKLGELFEALEHKLLGEHGFEDIVATIAALEQSLGIYELLP